MASYCEYNVFIFNFIKNNEKDVALLKRTFEQFNCRVKLYEHLNKKEFGKAASFIQISEFTLFDYMVIVILDNRNTYRHFVRMSDNSEAQLNRDLFTHVQRNETLGPRPLLFVMQTNQTVAEECTIDVCEQRLHSAAPIVRLYATHCDDAPLEDHWRQPNADESPFIKAFCKHFRENATTLSIGEICDIVVDDLREFRDQPHKEGNAWGMNAKFGMAMDDDTKRNFFEE